jgi:hypothetical protein
MVSSLSSLKANVQAGKLLTTATASPQEISKIDTLIHQFIIYVIIISSYHNLISQQVVRAPTNPSPRFL